jgi:hypothetical protein
MSKLIRIALAVMVLCLSAAAQTETKNELGLSLGAGLVPQRTTLLPNQPIACNRPTSSLLFRWRPSLLCPRCV